MHAIQVAGIVVAASASALPDQDQPQEQSPFSEPAKAQKFTREQIDKFRQIIGSTDTLLISVDKVWDPLSQGNKAQVLEAEISKAAIAAGWDPSSIQRRLQQSTMESDRSVNDFFSLLQGIQQSAEAGAPYIARTIKLDGVKQGNNLPLKTVCMIVMPAGIGEVWPVETDYFERNTGLQELERNFQPQERIHAFLLAHEQAHCDDKNVRSYGDGSRASESQEELIRNESTADGKAARRFYAVYQDTNFIESWANMTALMTLRGISDPNQFHFSQFEVDGVLAQIKGEKSPSGNLSPTQIIDGTKIIRRYLTDWCVKHGATQNPKLPLTLDTLSTSQKCALLKRGLENGEISNPNAVAIANRSIKAYEYFMPQEALEMRHNPFYVRFENDHKTSQIKSPALKF
jgi:hypothetical protein